jgi:site-specific DNA-methyltransferase (adenine-specific)
LLKKGGKIIETILKLSGGKIVHGDNLEVLPKFKPNSVDSCISDFPYDLSFMGKKWDNTGNFYKWCFDRAELLFGVIKSGGYVAIFGHPKTNHRMKCAFEDAGFKIVEEIDWVYLTGMPKNQDIGKLFDKKAGAEREVIGEKGLHSFSTTRADKNHGVLGLDERSFDEANQLTAPATDLAKQWNGWKTAGLKPAHEPITIFQKPLEGTYIQNIEKYGCGGMNIDACRVPISKADIDMLNAKASKNPTTNYSDKDDKIYGKYAEDKCMPANEQGRFPANIILDEYVSQEFDEQTGESKSTGGTGKASRINRARNIYGAYNDKVNEDYQNESLGGYGDSGGGSRLFTIIKYCPKVSPSERLLPNGERNPHVTLKPIELIKWLIKLLTPVNGVSIDITAGSCTHAVACQELNKNDGYNLKWIDIELTNTEDEPYCNVGKMRVEAV